MPGSRTTYVDQKDTTFDTGARSGSEAIRKRVAQLLVGSHVSTSTDRPGCERGSLHRDSSSSDSNRSTPRGTSSKLATKDKPLPAFPASLSRSQRKTKPSGKPISTNRSENKNPMLSALPTIPLSHFAPFQADEPREAESSFSSHRSFKNLSTGSPSHHAGKKSHIHPEGSDKNVSDKGFLYSPLSLSATDHELMKREIVALKEEVQRAKNLSKRYAKKLVETKAELNATLSALKDNETELSSVKGKSEANDELLSTIESSVLCQICMELPENPFSLAPCGHVLCLSCLREWFRKAPPTLDDMDIDPNELSDPHYILMRTKSCPSCRAVVKHRPAPVFMVKAVVSALKKSKPPLPGHLTLPAADAGSDFDMDDPWKGIFPSSEEESGDGDSDGSVDEFAFDAFSEDEGEGHDGPFQLYDRHGIPVPYTIYADFTSSDSDNAEGSVHDGQDENDSVPEEGRENDNDAIIEESSDEERDYVLPRWTPPSVEIDARAYDMSDNNPVYIKLLQRGCSWEMIQNYDISYSHSLGIIISLHTLDQLYASDDEDDGDSQIDGLNRVFLGWNIVLEDNDHDGDIYMTKILEDIRAYPWRWLLSPRRGFRGATDVKRLVPADEVVEYDSTDTETWLNAETEDR